MEKTVAIGVGIVIIIIIGILAYFLYSNGNLNSLVKTNTVSATTAINTTTNTIVNKTKTQQQTTVLQSTTTQQNNTSLSDCISGSSTVPIYNGNFSTGTYAGWNVTGQGFGTAPANITEYNKNSEYYNSAWSNYNGEYFATTYDGGILISTGNLTSNSFEVTEPYLNFKIVSPQDNLLQIEILQNGAPVMNETFNSYGNLGAPSGTFENATIPLTQFICKNISIRIYSGVVYTPATKYDIIAAGDFYLSKTPIGTTGKQV
ncbi:MAG: hypothetical protein ACP5M9_02760 [Candidatus Micrarchaeia archaeon]